MREGEDSSRQLLDSIPGLVALLTAAGEVEFCNRQVLEYTGRTLEELKHWGTSDTIHAEDLPHVIQVFTHAIASGSSYEILQRLRRSDGEYRWFKNNGHPLRDAGGTIVRWCVLLTDVDQLKRAEDALRANELNFQLTVDTIPGMVHTMTATGGVEFVNRRILDFLGKTLDELNNWAVLIHPDDRSRVVDAWMHSVATGEPYEAEHRVLCAEGTYRWLQSRGLPLRDTSGNIVRWYNLLTDIDDRKRGEAALNRARSELARVARVTTVSALTASIAHEVNQPLSGIITNAGTCLRMLAADPPDLDGARETAKRLVRDGNRAAEVIARLRALFSKKEFTLESLDLNDVTNEVIALSLSDLQREHVVLQSELADDLPAISGDRVQLQQVILNLVRNASDAMLEVHERPRRLLVKTQRQGVDHVRLTVRDSGTGVSQEHLGSVFDAFYTTKAGGMGIGLFVSRSIIETHHGRLWAEPNQGAPGVAFSFSIPHAASVSASRTQ